MKTPTILAIIAIMLIIADILMQFNNIKKTKELLSENNQDLLELIEQRYEVEVE